MKKYSHFTATACAAAVLLLAACSNNNTNDVHNAQDTNLSDSRRFTDTTSNYITDDSAGIERTSTNTGKQLDQ